MADPRARRITVIDDLRHRNNLRFLNTKRMRDERHEDYMSKLKNITAENLDEISEYAQVIYVDEIVTVTGGGNGYTLKFEGYFPVLGASTSVWIGRVLSLGNTQSDHYVYPPKAGSIKLMEVYTSVGSFSSGESADINLYKNGSIVIVNTATMDLYFAHGNSGSSLNIPIVETDELIVEIATPAWTVNPGNVQIAVVLYIE